MAVPLPTPAISIDFEAEWKHSAKTQRLMEEIDSLKQEDPTIKALIFSQWTSVSSPDSGSGDETIRLTSPSLAFSAHPTSVFLSSLSPLRRCWISCRSHSSVQGTSSCGSMGQS